MIVSPQGCLSMQVDTPATTARSTPMIISPTASGLTPGTQRAHLRAPLRWRCARSGRAGIDGSSRAPLLAEDGRDGPQVHRSLPGHLGTAGGAAHDGEVVDHGADAAVNHDGDLRLRTDGEVQDLFQA